MNETGRAEALVDNLPFALAAYLIMAEPSVYFQYQWWYASNNGMVPCPADPASCAFPYGFYPEYKYPLGAPLGPAVLTGYVYTRSFQHANATLNLINPAASGVYFAF